MDGKQWCRLRNALCALVLAAASAFGCARKPDESRTHTTGADDFIERTRVIDDVFIRSEDNPAGWGTDAAVVERRYRDGGPPAERAIAGSRDDGSTARSLSGDGGH